MKTDTGRTLQRDSARPPAAPADARRSVARRTRAAARRSRSSTSARRATWPRATAPCSAAPWPTCSPSPSTRTRVSFELAAKRLGADVVNLEVQLSSRVKGETHARHHLHARGLHVDVFVLRDAEAGRAGAGGGARAAACQRAVGRRSARLASHAGTARRADHPASARRRCDGLWSPSSATSGIRASRARRWHALQTLGVGELRFVAPPALDARAGRIPGLRSATPRSTPASRGADVVMMLRIQKERMATSRRSRTPTRYFAKFGLSPNALALAKPDAIVHAPAADEPRRRDRLATSPTARSR